MFLRMLDMLDSDVNRNVSCLAIPSLCLLKCVAKIKCVSEKYLLTNVSVANNIND